MSNPGFASLSMKGKCGFHTIDLLTEKAKLVVGVESNGHAMAIPANQ